MSLEIRIKKLEERLKDLKDYTSENTSSIEDLYDTVNNIKSSEYNSDEDDDYYPSQSRKSSSFESNNKHMQGANNKIAALDSILKDYKDKCEAAIDFKQLEQLLEYTSTIYCKDFPNIELITSHLDYFITLNSEKRNNILESISLHKNKQKLLKPILFTILESPLSIYHKQIAISKLKILETMDPSDAEYYKLKQWIDNLLEIPFGIYKKPAFNLISNENPLTQTTLTSDIIKNANIILDKAIYGQQRTKQHILEIVARMITNTSTKGTVFAVEGKAGTGKTSLIKHGLAPIFGLPFQFISLGGARDNAYLAGENYTYIGSKSGLIVQGLKQAGCMNPIFYFDVLDKVSNTPYGQEIINLLIHITDPAQNAHFQDVYLDGIPVDLSRALFIFSFNNRALVNPILLDRMEIIRFDKYTYSDKIVIVKKYVLPELITDYFGKDASNRVKVILEEQRVLFKKLFYTFDRWIRRSNKGGCVMRIRKACGIRFIKRRLEKVIARINLEELKINNLIKKRKIVIKPIDLDNL
jgi:ATP-dependent Lon protease